MVIENRAEVGWDGQGKDGERERRQDCKVLEDMG